VIGKNNPLNIRRIPGQRWLGSIPGAGPYEDFSDPKWCYRAAHHIVMKHWAEGHTVVGHIIQRWAPPPENPTGQYIRNVCAWMGQDPDKPLTLDQLPFLFHAMTRQEQGRYPYADDSPIYEGIELDGPGAPPPVVHVAPVVEAPPPPFIPPQAVPQAVTPEVPKMDFSWKIVLSPVVACVASWLAGKGLNLTPDQVSALTVITASLLTTITHVIHEKSQE
jgi:hypothetical protein